MADGHDAPLVRPDSGDLSGAARRDPQTGYPRPRATPIGGPGVGVSGYRRPSPDGAVPGDAGMARTALKAAGQGAQLGLGIGVRFVRRLAARVPRP